MVVTAKFHVTTKHVTINFPPQTNIYIVSSVGGVFKDQIKK